MIRTTMEIERLMDEISGNSHSPMNLYLIGGGALIYLGSKQVTKDLDLIVTSTQDYQALREILFGIGFQSVRPTLGMERTELTDSLTRGAYRIDLFNTTVCGCLQLTDGMTNRAVKRYSVNGIALYTCSPEDIFLFKSVTEREGDVEDSVNLLKSNPFRWTELLDEISYQMTLGDASWITLTTERIIGMREFEVPIRESVRRLELAYMERWADQFEKEHSESQRGCAIYIRSTTLRNMDFEDVIRSRYSVRKYSSRPVEEDKLQKILEAGRLAHTAKNMQGQHVYVVRSPEMRKRFDKEWCMHFDAPVVLIISMRKELEWISHFSKLNRGETDAAIVTDEMMLQAHALGLGTCWVGWFDPEKVKEAFDLPDDETVYNLLPLGYPADDCKPGPMHGSRKPLDETVTYL